MGSGSSRVSDSDTASSYGDGASRNGSRINVRDDQCREDNRESEVLDRMRCILRREYLSDIESVQRRVSSDPGQWAKKDFEAAIGEIKDLTGLIDMVDSLELRGRYSSNGREVDGGAVVEGETSCPICYEDYLPPKTIFSCANGHSVCKQCLDRMSGHYCSQCREDFWFRPPRRNRLAEKLCLRILRPGETRANDQRRENR